jgi:hypothetical protein
MRRLAAMLAMGAAAWSTAAWAEDVRPSGAADAPPASSPAPVTAPPTLGADQIEFAAREHDLGYRAYLDKQYAEAASHFENAFFAAPNPAELRSAVRARLAAGELARAATLAALGQRRFPDDPATRKIAAEVMAQARPRVYEVQISSPTEYSLVIDAKMVMAERERESRVFVNPGAHEMVVSWSDDRNARISIDAKEGGSESMQLDPPPPTPLPPSRPPFSPPSEPALTPPAESPVPVATESPPPKPFDPTVFVVGAALTTVAAGLTVWSGIETEISPGASTVHQVCAGVGPDCGPYQTGRNEQLRTNILLATTGGLAVATAVVGLFFTQWQHGSGAPVRAAAGLRIVPVFGIARAGVEGTF